MKFRNLVLGLLLAFSILAGRATELFVSLNGGHVAPFSDWPTAATNIQSAIDAATSGDVVTVTNGIYAEGGKVKAGDLTNRIAVDKPVLVRSVNGPGVTIIQGAWDLLSTNGPGAVRCAWLTNGATLSGFTLRGGATRISSLLSTGTATNSGGGVWSASWGSVVTNCILTGNAAQYCGGGVFSNTVLNSVIRGNLIVVTVGGISGGGAYDSVLRNCALLNNRILHDSSGIGGGAYRGTLTNCTVVGNHAFSGGGVWGTTFTTPVVNSIIWGNTSPRASATDTNYSSGVMVRYSCSGPLPSGTGNISVDPQILGDNHHLATASPCRGLGNALLTAGSDIDGMMWSNPPSMGCDEWSPEPALISQPRILPGPQAELLISFLPAAGQEPSTYFWLKSGAVLSGSNYNGLATVQLVIKKLVLADAGEYQVVASNAFGMATSMVANVTLRCVNVAGTSPVAPYTDWSSAATNIQTAINAAAVGDIVLVTNGVYSFGGKVMAGDLMNRVVLDKSLIVMSVNGPTYTTIEGTPGPGGVNSSIGPNSNPNNTNAVRCAWLANGAILSGFTLRGGGTRANSTGSLGNGGGVWCVAQSSFVSYCNIIENSAYNQGGGVYNGTLNNCTIFGNSVGRSDFGFSTGSGGGTYNSILINCLVRANQAGGFGSTPGGGGAYGGTLTNCTVIGNSVQAGLGGGVRDSIVRNSIVWNNSANITVNSNIVGGDVQYSCIGSAVSGMGNITSDPLFIADGFHLSSASACLSAGSPAFASGSDIDGQGWTNPPSMGCDQWLPEPLILDFKIQASHWNQFDFKTIIAGIESSRGYWLKDGVILSESLSYVGTESTALAVKDVMASDGGNYQLVVSNSFGMTTSRVANVTIHFANAGNPNASPPYTTWEIAADTIQDAIDAATGDDVVVVTNGIYNRGGRALFGWDVTNRLVLDKAVTVVSVNGPFQTAIEGQWDPITTNGMNAVRCALLWSNSCLAGFTLRNGAAGTNGLGGGVSASSDELVSSCVLSNNRAYIGGGAAFGKYNNCWFVNNSATFYAGAVTAGQGLNNCTVVANSAGTSLSGPAASARITNCIVWFNSPSGTSTQAGSFFYSCSAGISLSSGNITNDPQLVDGLHLAATSPCRGAGASIFSNSTDLDRDVWLVPPSMGCDEFNAAATVGPLFVTVQSTNALVNHTVSLIGGIVGRAARVEWNFGDGNVLPNGSYITSHAWTNVGDYLVTFTAFNADNPGGITGSTMIHIDPIFAPTMSLPAFTSGTTFQFQFGGQSGANYLVEYTTNLSAPITWLTVRSLTSKGGVHQILDTKATNSARFYRVQAQ